VTTVAPQYPEGARQSGESGIVIISITIGGDGRPAEPRVVKPLSTLLTYASLEALKDWTFEPAPINATATETGFCLTINYKLK
jgi:TonB family protein